MRKINITPYLVKADDKGTQVPYDVRGSIVNSLYHPDLKLSAKELLDNDRLAQKIKGATDSILLEDAEWDKVSAAFNKISGFGINDVELVNRVLNAEEIEVKEK
jgi:hypothetical protein